MSCQTERKEFDMKKCRITILKTTLDKELAEEYGVPGLKACPLMQEGQVFWADYAKPEGFCDEAWKAVYSTPSRSRMARARDYFITETGFGSREWPYAAAMTACAL